MLCDKSILASFDQISTSCIQYYDIRYLNGTSSSLPVDLIFRVANTPRSPFPLGKDDYYQIGAA